MKKMNRNFTRLAAAFLMTAGLIFSGCSNLFENIDDNNSSVKSGKAKVSLSVGLKELEETDTSSRTVMAKADDNKDAASLTEIKFYGKLSSSTKELESSDNLIASWETYKDMQLSPYSEEMSTGSYDFMLTAKNYGATMKQTIRGKALTSGSNTSLIFNSLTADPNGAQTGVIEITLTHRYNSYAGGSVTAEFKKFVYGYSKPYPSIAITLDGNVIATKTSEDYSIVSKSTITSNLLPDDKGNTYKITSDETYFRSAPVAAGFHVVTYTFTAPDDSVFVYPLSVFVEAGYLSKNDYDAPFNSSRKITKGSEDANYTITYISNTSTSESKTQTFYTGSSIADAEALGFTSDSENKRFKEWNTAANGSGTSYKAGDTPDLNGDLTLYAQWSSFKKVTYLVNLTIKNSSYQDVQLTDTYIQKFEYGSALESETTAFPNMSEVTYSVALGDKRHYTFCGWDTKADGSGIRYVAGAKPEVTEDLVLYAQWCGEKVVKNGYMYSGYYEISNVNQWNALMGAPFTNTSSGIVSADINIIAQGSGSGGVTISAPALSLTKGKKYSGKLTGSLATFSGLTGPLFDELEGESEISSIKFYGPVCNTNNGTISNVTVTGFTITGSTADGNDCVGAVCDLNVGTISDCIVQNCTVDGETKGLCYTGGICGKNEGTISGDSTKISGTIKGSKKVSEESFTGGYCGYNSGTITGKGSVDITLSGSTDTYGYYGYVIGKNASDGSVSTDITTNAQEIVLDTGTIELDNQKRYTVTLERTSLVTVTFTDTDANGAELNGYFTKENTPEKPKENLAIIAETDIKNESKTGKKYVEKGTYYVYLKETFWKTNEGCSAKVVID